MAQFEAWTPELEVALAAPFPPEAHKTKKLGGNEITFVSVWDYVNRLNELVGVNGWGLDVDTFDAGGKLIAACRLTILGVTKTNLGDEKEEKDDFGTAATNSWAQGFKRACSLFGLGLYLYDKKGREAATKPKPAPKAKAAPKKTTRSKDPEFPSGDFKGKKLSEVPLAYLFVKEVDFEKVARDGTEKAIWWHEAVKAEIARRKAGGEVKANADA
jgi:hypothetical protein